MKFHDVITTPPVIRAISAPTGRDDTHAQAAVGDFAPKVAGQGDDVAEHTVPGPEAAAELRNSDRVWSQPMPPWLGFCSAHVRRLRPGEQAPDPPIVPRGSPAPPDGKVRVADCDLPNTGCQRFGTLEDRVPTPEEIADLQASRVNNRRADPDWSPLDGDPSVIDSHFVSGSGDGAGETITTDPTDSWLPSLVEAFDALAQD